MQIVVLSRNESLYSTRALVEAAKQRGHAIRVLDTLRFDIRVSRRKPELFYEAQAVGHIDAVIPHIALRLQCSAWPWFVSSK